MSHLGVYPKTLCLCLVLSPDVKFCMGKIGTFRKGRVCAYCMQLHPSSLPSFVAWRGNGEGRFAIFEVKGTVQSYLHTWCLWGLLLGDLQTHLDMGLGSGSGDLSVLRGDQRDPEVSPTPTILRCGDSRVLMFRALLSALTSGCFSPPAPVDEDCEQALIDFVAYQNIPLRKLKRLQQILERTPRKQAQETKAVAQEKLRAVLTHRKQENSAVITELLAALRATKLTSIEKKVRERFLS